MLYCGTCKMDLTGVELEKDHTCPICEEEIHALKNQKLIDLIRDLNQATIKLMNKDQELNPKQLGEFVRIIEKGERTINKEYAKRIEHLKEIDYELSVISKFSNNMGYTLNL